MTILKGLLPIALLCGTTCPAQHGVLDTTFGNGGYAVFTSSGPGGESLNALRADPYGRVVVAGHDMGTLYDLPFIVRLTENGVLDSTFNSDGHIQLNLCISNDYVRDVAFTPDSFMYILGHEDFPSPTNDAYMDQVVVGRMTPTGYMDLTYGVNGLWPWHWGAQDTWPHAFMVMPDGGVLVSAAYGGTGLLIRRDATGALDSTFGTGGIMEQDFAGNPGQIRDFTRAQSGSIYGGGMVNVGGGLFSFIVRMNDLGVLDPTFSGDGYVHSLYQGSVLWQNRTFEMPDGGVLNMPRRRKYDASGTAIPAFGAGTTWACAATSPARIDGAMASNGSLFMLSHDAGCDTIVTAIAPDGTLDTSFGDVGYIVHNATPWMVQYCVVDDEDRLLVAGPITGGVMVARYLLDTTAISLSVDPPTETNSTDRLMPNPWSPDVEALRYSSADALQRAWLIAVDGRFMAPMRLRSLEDHEYSLTPSALVGAGTYFLIAEDVHGKVHALPLLIVD